MEIRTSVPSNEAETALIRWAEERGFEVAWGSARVVAEARAEVLERHASGELDDELFRSELEPITEDNLAARAISVVMVATPARAHLVRFDLGDRVMETMLPPTYYRYRPTIEEVRQDMLTNAVPGAQVEHLAGPLKAVAARLGLVRYGRNNLAFAPRLGSWLQLCGYLTDLRLSITSEPTGQAPELLAECDGCDRCRLACPTGAIADDRLLLHAERCLTYANESPGAWPAWVPSRSHHCLLGCLLCQRVCPVNSKLPTADSGVTFSADETRALISQTASAARVEHGIRKKLAWLGQPDAECVLGRNLRALLDRGSRAAGAQSCPR